MRPTPSGRRHRRAEEGELEVFAGDEQSDHPVDVERWASLARAVLEAEGVEGAAELSLLFVDESTIAGLNARFMGHEGPTDVLSFPLDADAVEGGHTPDRSTTGPARLPIGPDRPLLLGDVVVCPAVAARNAPEHAGTYEDELALLVVHGTLHVLGMDHAEADEATAMAARERELLERFHGPVRAGTVVPGAPERAAADAPAGGEEPADGGGGDPAPA